MDTLKKPELLAPAGSPEKLEYALKYGADAVYCAGKNYGLRSGAGNFTLKELEAASRRVHDLNKRLYVTLNASLKDTEMRELPEYVKNLSRIGVDHVIVADPGVFYTVRETVPEMKISVSTQANTLNSKSALFWYKNGARRIVLARELGLERIKEIIDNKPADLEIEMFVHGAMCISYSGRCLLSNYMTGRDANQGNCAQPCRWNYKLKEYALIESQRPDEQFSIEEDERGSFIFNSKDLCLIDHIPTLIEAGVSSFKIEGRMKSPFYVASVTSAYRQKIDDYFEGSLKEERFYRDELEKISHRDYTTAFFDRQTDERDQNYGTSSYIRDYDFAGVVLDYDESTGLARVEQRNKILAGDRLEILQSGERGYLELESAEIFDGEGERLESTPHAKMEYFLKSPPVKSKDIIRKKRNGTR